MRGVRSVAALAVLTTTAALVGISPAAAAGAAATSPPAAAAAVARTRGPHVMPMRTTTGAARSTVVAAAAPVGSHLTYYGGRVVSRTEVVQVLWGAGSAGGSNGQYLSQVLNTASPSVATFYQGVLNSSYVDWLSEYTTPSQTIGRGSFVSQVTITPSTSATTISDATIQSELKAQITAGNLPAPHQDAAGNNNTYYAIFFPHGKKITLGTSSSCVTGGFVAYHGTIANVGGHEIYYGVHPDVQTGSGCEGQGNTGTVFGDVTAVASHELVEMMTDPEVGIATVVGPPLAWYDATNGEIGDICNAIPGTTTGSDGLTYSVQTEWSNAQGVCTVGAPAHDFSLAATPATVLAGTSGTSSVTSTVVRGTAETVALTVTGLPTGATAAFSPTSVTAGGGSTLTLSVGAAVAAGSYPLTVKGTAPSVARTTTLTLTVTRAPVVTSAASTTFTAGSAGTFTVTTTGSPTASLTESGALPSGISFTDKGNGTATLAGTTATGGSFPITITAHNGAAADASQAFTLVVDQAAAVTSASSTTFGLGVSGTFSVTATGFPKPSLAETGALPVGVALTDNGNGTATLAGTPAAGSEGVYAVTITASNGIGTPASQSFSLTVTRQAAITSAASTTFVVGSAGTFSVTTVGVPKASISRTGTLPTGVTFVDNGNGTGTLAGTPAAGQAGSYPLTFSAHNGIGSDAVQSFVLTVHQAAAITSAASTTFVVGSPGSFSVLSTGDPVPSLSESGPLPTGLTFVDNGDGTASLSGTPGVDALPSYPVTITAHNGVGSDAQQPFVLHVDRPATITSAASVTFVVGTSGSFALTSSGSPTPSLTRSGVLPTGVTFTDNGNGTATLSGTPAAGQSGSYPLTFTAHNGVGADAGQSFVLTVHQAAVLVSAASTRFVVGTPGTFTVMSTGDPAPTLSESGMLPTGVTFLDNGDGTASLSGTPGSGSATSYTLTVTAHNGVGPDAQQSFVLHVDRATAVTSAAATTFVVDLPSTFTVTTTGAPSASLTRTGALPTGVTFLDNGDGTGTLSGTPAAGTATSYPLTFSAHNGVGADAVQSFVLTVHQAAAISSAASARFVVGSPGSFPVTSTGDPVPALTEVGALPPGVTFVDNGDGTASLAGTPGAGSATSYTVTITAHNGVGSDAQQPFILHVDRPASITIGAAPIFTAGTPGTFTVTSTGWPLASLGLSPSSVLPGGVTFVDNGDGTATLAGTPTPGTAGAFPLTVTAHNGVGPDGQRSFVLTVNPAVVVTTPPSVVSPTASLPATIGDAVSYTVHASGVPVPTLKTSSVLPAGLALVDHGDGTATLSGVPASGAAGIYTVVLFAANGVGSSVAETITVVVERRATVLRYAGATSGSYAGVVPLSAMLLDAVTGAPVGARSVHLVVGTQGIDAVTSAATGTAAASVTLTQPSGTVALSAAFDGDASYAGSSVEVPPGFVVTRRTAVVTTGPGYVRQLTVVRGRTPAFTVHAAVGRPSDAPIGDLASLASVGVGLVPIAGGATRSCVATPGSPSSPMTRTSTGGWNVACRFAAGLPLGVYEVVVSVGTNGFWAGGTADVLLVTTPTASGARGAGRITGVGLPAESSVAFAFSAQRAGRRGRSISGRVVSVLSVTDPVSGVVTQHVLTSRSVSGLTVRSGRAPYTAVLSGTGRWDSSAPARFSLAVRDATGAVGDGDRYSQVIAPPAAASSAVVGLLRLRGIAVRSGDIAVR